MTDQDRLDQLFERLRDFSRRSLGYPANGKLDTEELHRFLRFPLNNIGDPFVSSTFQVNTRDLEVEVLRFFGELMHAPDDSIWGYVTNGGTEGNTYGLYLARELFPTGMVYMSEDSHYSVGKILRVLGMRHIMIRSDPGGRMDAEDLEETIRIHRDVPPIVLANIGTTMKEAVDDLPAIRAILKKLAVHRSYVHCDAALCGMTLPFIDGAPPFDFAAGADSLSISGHKMIGSPVPCGIVLAKRRNVDRIARSVEYVGALDTTLSGSRNGFSPLILWHAIRRHGRDGFKKIVGECLATAEYAVERLRAAGLSAWRHPHALTVVFPAPAAALAERWQLAVQEGTAHLIAMPHVTRALIDEFVKELRA